MTLIHTAELEGVNPLDFVTELLRHPSEANEDAEAWMPWNYRKSLKQTA